MPHKTNETLGVSFDLPDSLTVDELDAYQSALQTALTQYSNGKSPGTGALNMTDARYFAIIYGVAAECGLIHNWQCARQPELSPANVGKADAKVIYFVGRTIREYAREITEIPPP